MEHEGIILVNSPITTFQQSLTHSALLDSWHSPKKSLYWVTVIARVCWSPAPPTLIAHIMVRQNMSAWSKG